MSDTGCRTVSTNAEAEPVGSVGGLWPSPDYARQVERFARPRDPRIALVKGRAGALPFADGAFDYALAMTSLSFVPGPGEALRELWRISRRAVALGLLHRRSLLDLSKHGRRGYRGARWDLLGEVLG